MTQVEIITGRVCPYCGNKPQLMDSCVVYGQSYGPIWACMDCDAWVGCHPGGDKPLGRLANKELRNAKKEAHGWFDPLWKKKMEGGAKKFKARGDAYKWLASEMKMPAEQCHIGMFDVDNCKRVMVICKQYYRTTHKENSSDDKNRN